ncbi:MAG: peptide chain release factor N(5)-glutamine methyltransferase [Candidatus Falkowbacteria bacterium]|nr:peptide chain release factor N(5)-glutamine methyltransferase [Candidatus Falkowbacteria bacterium]
MTIGEALKNAYQKARKDQNKKLEQELLLAFVLDCDRSFLLINHQQELSKEYLERYQELVKKLFSGWPLAYLTGEREFYGRPFLVSPATLIPRPESEMIVDIVKEEAKKYQQAVLVDVGTGSGCLIISLASELGKDFKYYGLDISEKALKVAKDNAKINRVKVNFKNSNLLSGLPKQSGQLFIIANLPYLTKEQVVREVSIKKEPRSALISGKDGFKDYRNLFEQLADRKDLRDFYLIIEIDPSQAKLAKIEANKYLPNKKVELIKDLRGKHRFAIIK